MFFKMTIVLLVTLLFITGQLAFDDNDLYGISHVAITVDDLDKSTIFYTDIFGGMLVEELSESGVYGDDLYYGMFQKEILEAEAAGKSLDSYGICDIKDTGTKMVRYYFVHFRGI